MRLSARIVDALRSPRRFLGFLRRAGEVTVRGELVQVLDRMHARGPTAREYAAWRMRLPPPEGAPVPFVVLLDPEDAADRSTMLAGVEALRGEARAIYFRERGGWAANDSPRALSEIVEEAPVPWLWWITAPVSVQSEACAAVAQACALDSARIAYGDHEIENADSSLRPVFKSAWDAEQLRERPYTGPLVVVHPSLATMIEMSDGPHRMLRQAAIDLPSDSFVHVPRVLFRCAEHVPPASVSRIPVPEGLVSLVIPTRDRPELLARCLESLREPAQPLRIELVIVDNGSTDPGVGAVLEAARRRFSVQVVNCAEPFNFARLCNQGVAAARGRVVVLLNNDTRVIDDGWLDELVALATRPHIGAVGPLLLYADGRAQSAGVLVGVNRGTTSALEGFRLDDPVAREWCASRRRISAVIGACLAIERAKYLEAGGMDEQFAVSHNEVDLCLRLESRGLVNLFTPFARIEHAEGATRGFEVTAEERSRLAQEEALFRHRWSELLAATDPAHHPALAREGNPFLLAREPVDLSPRAGWRSPARG